MAHKQTGVIPEKTVVRYVLGITATEDGADWPVRAAALEALLRRLASAHKEGLRPATPLKRPLLGTYTTRRKGISSGPRPYTTVLQSVSPPAGSCDCEDFLKSSLGLCKHLLTLLEAVYARPARLRAALREQSGAALQPVPRLYFHPIRPLTGKGDWLMQVRWQEGQPRAHGALLLRLRRCFAEADAGATTPVRALRPIPTEAAQPRLDLVDDLIALQKRLAARQHGAPRDPALVRLLTMERERLLRRVAGEKLATAMEQSLTMLRQPLYPYQQEGVRRFLQSGGRLLLADDMGLGKTAQAIAACGLLWQSGRVRRGVIIMPSSLKSQWLREWRLFCDTPIAVVEGTPAQRAAAYRQTEAGFLLVHYEQVLRDLPLLHTFTPDLVVLDEAQRIKNWATKTAAFIKTLEAPYRLVLTGTPMENRLDELASILEWVDPLAIEPKWRLAPWHTQHGAEGVAGARNLDTLRQRLASCMLRRVRQDVLKQLPARTDTRIPVEMTPQQREEHDALNQQIAQLIAILSKRPLSPAQHLRLMSLLTTQRIISNGLAQLHFTQMWPMIRELSHPDQTVRDGLFSPKLGVLRELLLQLVVGQGRKVVVFSQWRRMLRLAEWAGRDVLAERGARAVFFTGGQSAALRTQVIAEFHDNPDVRVMYLTDAGGVGLNLQRAASACINLELPWNPAVLEQRISRIYRIGQKLPINVYNLITDEGIEARITDLVGNKKALFTGLFDGTSDELRFERSGSLLARIGQLIAPPEPDEEGSPGFAEPEESPAAEQAISELLAAADESQDEQNEPAEDQAVAASGPASAESREPATESAAVPEAELPSIAASVPIPHQSEVAEALQRLLSDVTIRPGAGGGLTLTATPAAAATLAGFFQRMASMLTDAVPEASAHSAASGNP